MTRRLHLLQLYHRNFQQSSQIITNLLCQWKCHCTADLFISFGFSCFACVDSMNNSFTCLVKGKQVKQEVSCTEIHSPMVVVLCKSLYIIAHWTTFQVFTKLSSHDINIRLCFDSNRRQVAASSVTSKKSPNVYKNCPKMISL